MEPDALTTVAVVGAGEMGPGIALSFARHGVDVTLIDQSHDQLDAAADELASVTDLLVERGELDEAAATAALDCIETATDIAAVADADYVTEAVTEDLEVKREVFAALDRHTDDDVILATNTSSLDLDEIAAATDRPERVIVTHWMNPPWVVPVVEVVVGEATSEQTRADVVELLEGLDRSPVVLTAVVPGYLINRMNFALAREALHLIDRGVVEKEAIDTLFTDAFGPRYTLMGPIEMLDLFGHDTNLAISEYLFPDLCDDDEPSPLIEDLVERGDLGMKTGEGFYEYTETDDRSLNEALLDRYRQLDI